MTIWLQGTDATKQMRAQVQANFSAQQVSLDIFPFVCEMGDAHNGSLFFAQQMQACTCFQVSQSKKQLFLFANLGRSKSGGLFTD